MVWKPMHGFRDVPAQRGEVVGVNTMSYTTDKMLVRLESGDYIIQDVEESRDAWVSFKPDFRVVSSVGRASDF